MTMGMPAIETWNLVALSEDPPVDGWFAAWVSYGESEDDMSFEAWQFLNGEPVAVPRRIHS
jgi:hypothetical protein